MRILRKEVYHAFLLVIIPNRFYSLRFAVQVELEYELPGRSNQALRHNLDNLASLRLTLDDPLE